jgi:hypothetical protein
LCIVGQIKVMEKIKAELINAWRPLFELEPELKALPVYAWGRYYKYELSGDPFETFVDEDGFEQFVGVNGLQPNYKLQAELIQSFDEKYNEPGGSLWTGEMGDYSPLRSSVVSEFNFDSRGGMCLIVVRNEDEYDVIAVRCDSPE